MIFERDAGNYLLIRVPNSGSLMQFEIIVIEESDYNLVTQILSFFGKRIGFEKKAIMNLSMDWNPTNPNNIIV